MSSNVDLLYYEFLELISYLDGNQEISLRSIVDANFRKTILLAAASYFERQISDDLLKFFNNMSNQNELVTAFVKNKAVTRQYHTYFQWDAQNANAFFGLFGGSFKVFMKQKINDDPELDVAIKAFLSIGLARNRLVHQNFGTFVLEMTAADIYGQYLEALKFVEAVPKCIEEFCNQ